MKKLITLVTGIILVLSLAACTPTTKKVNADTSSTQSSHEEQSTGGAFDKVPDPAAKPLVIVSLYLKNAAGDGLDKEMNELEILDAQALLDKLIQAGMLDADTKALDFGIHGTGSSDVGPGVASPSNTGTSEAIIGTLNLSKIPQLDSDMEKLLLTAIGNTFTENFDLDQLKIQVNGKDYKDNSNTLKADGYLEFDSGFKKVIE